MLKEVMKFSKAIQIKQWVNRWNEDRAKFNHGSIVFNCSMYSIGNWSVDITAQGSELFFSDEMEQLITLYAGGGFSMRVMAIDNVPTIDMQ